MEITKPMSSENHDDFDSFYQEHYIKIKISLMFLGEDEDSAKDIAQETLERLWVRWADFPNNYARIKFIRVVSKNMWIDKCRKSSKIIKTDQIVELTSSYTEEQVLYHELIHETQKALEKYDAQKKKIFNEIRIKGASYKEVSEKFDVNIKTLERYMSQMTKTVRIYLKKYYINLLPFLPIIFLFNFF